MGEGRAGKRRSGDQQDCHAAERELSKRTNKTLEASGERCRFHGGWWELGVTAMVLGNSGIPALSGDNCATSVIIRRFNDE